MLAYLEEMMSAYRMSYKELWQSFPVVVGFALLEARRERHGAEGQISYIDRAAMAARNAKRRELEAQFRIIEPAPQT